MTTAQPKPDTATPEHTTRPLTQQDYGKPLTLSEISRLARLPGVVVTVSPKVVCATRYVIEIEVNSDQPTLQPFRWRDPQD